MRFVEYLSLLSDSITNRPLLKILGKVEAFDQSQIQIKIPFCQPGMVLENAHKQEFIVTSCDDRVAWVTPVDEDFLAYRSMVVKLKKWRYDFPIFENPWGKVFDSQGNVLLGINDLSSKKFVSVKKIRISERKIINEVLPTGIRVIDGLLTLGKGQRVALMAGSGVGKTTLLTQLTRNIRADVKILCLIGERGREVLEFFETLSSSENSSWIIIAESSDKSAFRRVQALLYAVAMGQSFAASGKDVVILVDSLSRFAHALAQMLKVDQNVTYPPAVYQQIAQILEKFGAFSKGSLTGIFTVLAQQDDFQSDLVDHIRAIVDGHWILSRQLAEKQIFPAVDPLMSVSRIQDQIVDHDLLSASKKLKRSIATYFEYQDFIKLGLYKKGQSGLLDQIIEVWPKVLNYLCQEPNEATDFNSVRQILIELANLLPDEI